VKKAAGRSHQTTEPAWASLARMALSTYMAWLVHAASHFGLHVVLVIPPLVHLLDKKEAIAGNGL